jgi:hypothetical protein
MEQISGPRNAKALPLQGFQCSDPNYEGWNFRLNTKLLSFRCLYVPETIEWE